MTIGYLLYLLLTTNIGYWPASRERLEQFLSRQYELRAEKTKAVIRKKAF